MSYPTTISAGNGDFTISQEEIADMRRTRLAAYPDQMRVQRDMSLEDEGDDDAIGGRFADWQDVENLTDVPCKLAPSSGSEQVVAAKLTALAVWSVNFPVFHFVGDAQVPVDVKEADRLIIGDRTLNIESVERRNTIEISRQAICTEIMGQ